MLKDLFLAGGRVRPVQGARFMAFAALLVFGFSNDHTNLLYRCGERATFDVKVTERDGAAPTGGVLVARLDNFGPKKIAEAKWDLAETNAFSIAGTLDEPGTTPG